MHTSFQSSRREHRRRVRSMPARSSLASPISALRGALWRASRGAGRVDGPTLGTRDVVGWPAVADRAPSPASPGGKSPSACLWSLALGPNPYSRMCSACGTRCGVARRHRDRVAATDATATQHAPTIAPVCVCNLNTWLRIRIQCARGALALGRHGDGSQHDGKGQYGVSEGG